jgi:hypothetical protein
MLAANFCELTGTYKRFSDYSLDFNTKPTNGLYDVVVHARLIDSGLVTSGDCELTRALLDAACPNQIGGFVCEPRVTNCNSCEHSAD